MTMTAAPASSAADATRQSVVSTLMGTETAAAMAEGALRVAGADIAVSVTGIAGPGGGTEEKPVGTVYIGLFYQDKVQDTLHCFSGSRKEIQEMTAQTALDMVRKILLNK